MESFHGLEQLWRRKRERFWGNVRREVGYTNEGEDRRGFI
jgi:hypothetical protein